MCVFHCQLLFAIPCFSLSFLGLQNVANLKFTHIAVSWLVVVGGCWLGFCCWLLPVAAGYWLLMVCVCCWLLLLSFCWLLVKTRLPFAVGWLLLVVVIIVQICYFLSMFYH